MVSDSIIRGLAKGIFETNKNKQGYVAKIISGKHKGKYLSYHHSAVKNKSRALCLVRDNIDDWEFCFAEWDEIGRKNCKLVTYNKRGQ